MQDGAAPGPKTDWQAVALPSLMPLGVAANFVYAATTVHWTPSEDQIWGLVALVPLEFVRAIVLQRLGEAYRKNRDLEQAVHSFLVSIGLLAVAGIVWAMFNLGFGVTLALLVNSRVQHLLWIPELALVAECAMTLYFFRGDRLREAARIEAAAADAYDWIFLATFYLPPTLIVMFLAWMMEWQEGVLDAWFNNEDPDLTALMPPILFYCAAYFCGKAAVVSHVYTARFNQTGQRLLGSRWIQGLLMRSTEERRKEMLDVTYRRQLQAHASSEREIAARRTRGK